MHRPRRDADPAARVPEVMTISDLAHYLQVSKFSLYKLAQSGRVSGHKVGKHWRFSRLVIDNWIHSDLAQSLTAETRRM